MHILHLNQRNQRNQILLQYLRDKREKKEGAQKKGGGGENSPISPPLDPRLFCPESAKSYSFVMYKLILTRRSKSLVCI